MDIYISEMQSLRGSGKSAKLPAGDEENNKFPNQGNRYPVPEPLPEQSITTRAGTESFISFNQSSCKAELID